METQFVIAALADPAVKQQLVASLNLEAELERVLSDPSVSEPLLSQLTSQLSSDPRLRNELLGIISSPEVQQTLLEHIDLGALLRDLTISEQIKSQLDVSALLADPAVTSEILSSATLSLKQRLATDDASLDRTTLLVAAPLLLLLLAALYALVVFEVVLTCVSFVFYGVGFFDSKTFQWVWLFMPHWFRAVFGVLLAREVPSIHALLKVLVTHSSAVAEDSDERDESKAPPSLLPPELSAYASSVAPLVLPFGISYGACIVFDLIALTICFVWCHLVRDPYHVEVMLEQSALALFLALTVGFVLIDVAPLLLWPLLSWALPPKHAAAISRTASGAFNGARAKVGTLSAKVGGGGGGRGDWDGGGDGEAADGSQGQPTKPAKRESMMRSLLPKRPTPLETRPGAGQDRV